MSAALTPQERRRVEELFERAVGLDAAERAAPVRTLCPDDTAAARDVHARTDVYPPGVLSYELLSGVKPFGRDSFARAAEHEIDRCARDVVLL